MARIHAEAEINGIVQGVGFRPFIHKRVAEFDLSGEIRNTPFGVSLSLEGERERVEKFLDTLKESAPPLAAIYEIKKSYSEALSGYSGFSIKESVSGKEKRTFISPDMAVCDDCVSELFDKGDRRYRFPFINCTNCGPRFTITRDIPYDRKNTTMENFPMCEKCEAEYSDIDNRRYHAQPDCCGDCGPKLTFLDNNCEEVAGDAIENAKSLLSSGGICAIKGLGGYHLAVRADQRDSVRLLRERKRREEKPFAVMCRDIAVAREVCEISASEEKLLTSPRRPIVLLKKKRKEDFSYISENGYIGVMLPYTPVHHLIMEDGLDFLIMTSANLSDLPIIYKEEEVAESLRSIADGYLINNREIYTRCDDSLVWEYEGREYFARRSRGYVPLPVRVNGLKRNILACGAEQKASFSVSRDGLVFPSAHIGDLKNMETLSCFEEQVEHFERIFDIKPELLVCDMHPDYLSSEYARRRAKRENIPLRAVYHHHAHMASCMADNGVEEKCIGIVWDGTGYGMDGTSWGAEILYGDFKEFERVGTAREITLPGGDRATREISRIGISLLLDSGVSPEEIFGESAGRIKSLIGSNINCPRVSSMGRLFDGVSAIVGIRETVSFEGQAAMLLEAAADESEKVYPYEIENRDGVYVFDFRPMIRKLSEDVKNKVSTSDIASAFMNTLIKSAVETAVKISEEKKCKNVVISGGSFQNMYILKKIVPALRARGLTAYTHRQVSTNDEGISLGQLMIAERGGGEDVSCSAT